MSSEGDATGRLSGGASASREPGGSQFAPGTIIGDRYRISSLLGSGGMGEVYRADDLKLDQPVALKFLPAALANDAVYLEQLHGEVRLGRQIAHPNVCRIYDIGEAGGAHFVAMEYVDGEDLGRLLRRIGRLAHDKAVDIARGIAAGLSAAHAKGILHRDLKPANIMIDSRGDARITDFGLALASDDAHGANSAGTPAYMAPEQFDGAPATVQTDLYALGLVMYEVFTGRRARHGITIPELRSGEAIDTPSSFVRDIDPAVERMILRCLDPDPAMRPRSAREIYEAMPGGDALAAAMAAGETPSPRLVAAAGTEGVLSRRAAWSWLAATVVMFVIAFVLQQRTALLCAVPSDVPPEVLQARAAEIRRAAGLPEYRFRASGFGRDSDYLVWLSDHTKERHWTARLRTGYHPITMWLRESERPLITSEVRPRPWHDDPPFEEGMSDISVDLTGRLINLQAWPHPGPSSPRPTDWAKLTGFAGLDITKMKAVAPRELPPVFADERVAWDGAYAAAPDVPLHVEAAAVRGIPVSFAIQGPWSESNEASRRMPFRGEFLGRFLKLLRVAIFILTALLAWINYRRHRYDRTGAARIAATVFVLTLVSFLLHAYHSRDVATELSAIGNAMEHALVVSALFALLYIALEPHVRRRWPERMISWSRLVSGNLRDPMVGRDILIGITAGLAHSLTASLAHAVPSLLGGRDVLPRGGADTLLGVRDALGFTLGGITDSAQLGLAMIVVVVFFAIVFRRRSFGIAALYLVMLGTQLVASRGHWHIVISAFLIPAIYCATLARFGLLAMATLQYAFSLTFFRQLPVDPSSFAFAAACVPIVILAALALWAFRTSLGGQPAFSVSLLDD
jgi:serine/threonine-protein kinase